MRRGRVGRCLSISTVALAAASNTRWQGSMDALHLRAEDASIGRDLTETCNCFLPQSEHVYRCALCIGILIPECILQDLMPREERAAA